MYFFSSDVIEGGKSLITAPCLRLYSASKGALTREGITLKILAATCSASIGS